MRKSFNTYLIIWALALVLFNLIIFVIPSSINGETIINVVNTVSALKGGINNIDASLLELANYLMNSSDKEIILYKYAGAFWPCYVCIMFTFIGQLICSIYAFKETNNQKFFYKIPLITISYTGLVFTLIFGIIGMFFPDFPIWLGVTICIIIFVITLISLIKANLVSTIVSNKDDEIANSTAFMKEMTAKAKTLWDADKQNEDLRKLYEAFRYANPIINNGNNAEITKLFSAIMDKINTNNKAKEEIDMLVLKLKELSQSV